MSPDSETYRFLYSSSIILLMNQIDINSGVDHGYKFNACKMSSVWCGFIS